MADAAPVRYTRLPGSGHSRKGSAFLALARTRCRLWLGDDHLLQVESAGGYSENYKRFSFRDIQAITLHRTRSWQTTNIVLGILTALFLVLALSAKDDVGSVICGIITGALGVPLLINLLGGPTCVCYLRTAVHLEELPSLRRLRRAERVLALLRPLILASQGSPASETLPEQYSTLLTHANAVAAEARQPAVATEPAVSAYHSRAHQVLFLALLAEAAADALDIVWPGRLVILLGMLIGAVSTGAVVVALVKQHQTDLKFEVRVLAWAVAAFLGMQRITGYIILIVITQSQRLDGTQWGYITALAQLRPLETPWLLALLGISAGFATLAGVIGLVLLPRKTETAS